jgi:hypothetical protein
MGRACSQSVKILTDKPTGKIPLGRLRRREDNIIIHGGIFKGEMIKNRLKRREKWNIYLTHVCGHRRSVNRLL